MINRTPSTARRTVAWRMAMLCVTTSCIMPLFAPTSVAAEPVAATPPTVPLPAQESNAGISHTFFVTGSETYIISAKNYSTLNLGYVLGASGNGNIKSLSMSNIQPLPAAGRDGWVLSSGNILLAASKSDQYPGGAIIELDENGKTLFEFKGTQSEVDTVQPLDGGNILLTESGPKPRLMEINREGKILVEIPLQCQTNNFHMQTRMARKLANGNYLVPHLLDKVVREYNPQGKVVWEVKTPDEPKDSWPFTAIRLDNGNTLINCTHGDMVIEVDKDGKIVWQLTNADLDQPLLKDPCGAQRLLNGNTVITSYAAVGQDEVKMFEVTREKKVVWTYRSGRRGGVHHFQILSTNGKPLQGQPLR